MTSDFEPPPKNLSILASVGGVVTAAIAIAGLNLWSTYLNRTRTASVDTPETSITQPSPVPEPEVDPEELARLDAESLVLPGDPISSNQVTISFIPYIAPNVGELTPAKMAIARQAWAYFQRNWNDETCLVNSVDGFTSVTMWDQAAAIAALVSAKELNIISASEFDEMLLFWRCLRYIFSFLWSKERCLRVLSYAYLTFLDKKFPPSKFRRVGMNNSD
ncbi:MAG: DUF3131 domain-containing protein [Trichormus sp. ATA11-4-KO1]|jgi:hypothetical protein|nr:DUF3131 domain-containing protein [Trichormus sp. ATA11-4-KO1]